MTLTKEEISELLYHAYTNEKHNKKQVDFDLIDTMVEILFALDLICPSKTEK